MTTNEVGKSIVYQGPEEVIPSIWRIAGIAENGALNLTHWTTSGLESIWTVRESTLEAI